MAPASSKDLLEIHSNYREWIQIEIRRWHDNNITSNEPDRQVLTTQIKHLTNLGKWLSVHLRPKFLCVQISLLSRKPQIWCVLRARSYLTFSQTIECGFTLKLVRDMIMTNSQIHGTDECSQYGPIILRVSLIAQSR